MANTLLQEQDNVVPLSPRTTESRVDENVSEAEKTTASTAPSPTKTPAHPGCDTTTNTATVTTEQFFSDPSRFLNREYTWLNYTWRVLHEAEDPRLPLLERIRFLAIIGANLDEFFMKRIGGLKQQAGAGLHELTVDGRSPQQQIQDCYAMIRSIEQRAQQIFIELKRELAACDVRFVEYQQLDREAQKQLRNHYLQNIFPLVTPQAMDPAHPFPFVSNLSLNLLVSLHYPKESEELLARIKVPVGNGIPRFLRVGTSFTFVSLEQVISHNLDLLFPGMVFEKCDLFRVTRNANTELDEEEADDLLALIESELKERKFAPIVRLEIASNMNEAHWGMLAAELALDHASDVFPVEGLMGLRDLKEIAELELPQHRLAPHYPVDCGQLVGDDNIFHIIRRSESILVHHPYESFATSVERFLNEASEDPKVRAIKMTLYRTSESSQVLRALINAARNGKQVAVVVELKARFDEEANIRWASRLEEVGIHVTYGVVGLKTHCKLILVVRQDYTGLKRYAHIGTGNYHAGTARQYADLSLLTCDERIGHDLTEIFNYLTTGYRPKREYKKLLVAPKKLKSVLIEKIEREIKHHTAQTPGLIQFKMNALEDAEIVDALYRAAQAGVTVDLIVRDTCRLRPGIVGISHSIRVISIVGRFLEHSRIYYFRNGGDDDYFIGSADFMKRNLESRVECLVPIEAKPLRIMLRNLLDIQLADERSAWEMQSDGSYIQRVPKSDASAKSSQTCFVEMAEKRRRDVTRLKKRKTKGLPRRKVMSDRD